MKEAFGILALIIGVEAGLPYIYSVFRGSTKPHRVSWAIWDTLGLITLSSYLAKGAHWSALLAVAAAFNNLVIFLISLKFGTGGASKIDRIALALGIFGLLLWVLTKEAAFALLFAIFADSIATILTAHKAYKNPDSESGLSWSMAATASIFGFLAIQNYSFWQIIYPLYAVIGGLSLAIITISRKQYLEQNK